MLSESYYHNLLEESELIYEAIFIRKGTIRKASEELGIPKSTIHDRIHRFIKREDPSSYRKIMEQLQYNKLYRNKPRKYWGD